MWRQSVLICESMGGVSFSNHNDKLSKDADGLQERCRVTWGTLSILTKAAFVTEGSKCLAEMGSGENQKS